MYRNAFLESCRLVQISLFFVHLEDDLARM
jgi:hypothetical protein